MSDIGRFSWFWAWL